MRIETVFLAGPDVHGPDGAAVLDAKRGRCEAHGLRAVFAVPPHTEAQRDEIAARIAYADTCAALRGCDAVIANLTPWRGPSPEPSAVFEAGFAAALGRPVFAYANVADEEEADLVGRVGAWFGASAEPDGVWRDADGCAIEDLGLPETLMLWAEARRFFVVVTDAPFSETAGLDLCLEALKAYAD